MSLEFNKAAAAVLTAGITFMIAGVIAGAVVAPKHLERTAIALAEPTPPAGGGAAPAPAALDPIGPLLASADVDAGRQAAQRLCAACHTFTQGGANGAGPNLYGVIGSPHAHAAGFNYSAGMRGLHDKAWDYEALNVFLHRPGNGVPGTRMAFAGIPQAQQRANVIAFLRSLDASPKPLP